MRDRLKNLDISESYDDDSGRRTVRNWDPARFYRLFKVLNEFKNLTELSIQKTSENIIDFIEKAIENCPSLQKFTLYNDENEDEIDSTGVTISNYTPANRINHLVINGSIADNSLLLEYTIHKFFQLEKLEIIDRKEKPEFYLDEPILHGFIEYFSKVKDATLIITWSEETLAVWTGPLWKALSKSNTLSVEFIYCGKDTQFAYQMNVVVKDGLALIKIHYPDTEEITPAGLPADLIRKYGCYIDHLIIDGANAGAYNSSEHVANMVYQVVVYEPLKYCARLENFLIKNFSTKASDLPDDEPLEKRTISSLSFAGRWDATDVVYEGISEILSYIKHLELTSYEPVEMLISETDIGTLKLTTLGSNKPVLLVELIIGESCSYLQVRLQ